MERTLSRLTLVMLLTVSAGCAERPMAASVLAPVDPSIPPPAGLGAVAGHVATTEEMPLAEVGVVVAGLPMAVHMTDASGAYRVDGIEPGTYKVYFQRVGFRSTSQEVDVLHDNVTILDIVLESVPLPFPFTRQQHHNGYMALDVSTPGSSSRPGQKVDNNDANSFKTPLEPDLSTVLSGLTWEHAGPGSATRMSLSLTMDAQFEMRVDGASPVVARLEKWSSKTPKNVTQTVTLPLSDAAQPLESVTVAYQQKFSLFTTLYYNGKPPADASAVPQ